MNFRGPVTFCLSGEEPEVIDRSPPVMWEGEFREFCRRQEEGDLEECYHQLDQSLLVSRVQNSIRREAGVVFPAGETR